jgi:hypothetical protein
VQDGKSRAWGQFFSRYHDSKPRQFINPNGRCHAAKMRE